ncbi:DUF998 domain-containing protein [Nocardia sp. BMG111209]|uniref:DUF998 domain-containing protein n=1 Tax=Nocardia sp. BMG111209 TaxID=1160137 RepID=UPI0003709628|nr:DUF998 domain-containing protein [Nocardia sp. BMG111209]
MTPTEHRWAGLAVLDPPPAPVRRGPRVLRWCVAVAVALAGVCYSSWVLEFVLPIGLDPVNSFLSELDAQGRSYGWVFSTADTLTGILALIAAIGGIFEYSWGRLSIAAWVALGCFGMSTIADAQLPLRTCHPDPCPKTDDSGLFPQLHQIHALTSTLAVTSIFVAMIAFSAAAFRYRRWPVLRHSGLWILVLASAVTAWMLIADNLPGNYGLGIAQRIQIGSISLWLIALGVQLGVTARRAELSVANGEHPPGSGARWRRGHRNWP